VSRRVFIKPKLPTTPERLPLYKLTFRARFQNFENVILINDNRQIQAFQTKFDRLWEELDNTQIKA
jgi:hypothetical protein